jgi:hypothetical protein
MLAKDNLRGEYEMVDSYGDNKSMFTKVSTNVGDGTPRWSCCITNNCTSEEFNMGKATALADNLQRCEKNVPVIGVFVASDPRIDAKSRQRCQNIIRMTLTF